MNDNEQIPDGCYIALVFFVLGILGFAVVAFGSGLG